MKDFGPVSSCEPRLMRQLTGIIEIINVEGLNIGNSCIQSAHDALLQGQIPYEAAASPPRTSDSAPSGYAGLLACH